MRRSRLAAVALLSVLAGAGQAVVPVGALAAPHDPSTGNAPRTALKAKGARPAPGTVVLSTAQRRFDPGINNSGWWSDGSNNYDENDNFFVGDLRNEHRDFFTFDANSLPKHVVSATLRVNTALVSNLSGDEVLQLWDVSTDAATLNQNDGQNESIFADLGSGRLYGEYPVGAASSGQQLSLELDKAALRDLKHAAKHAPGGFFSIGGSLLNGGQDTFVFGNSGGLVVELVVRTRSTGTSGSDQ